MTSRKRRRINDKNLIAPDSKKGNPRVQKLRTKRVHQRGTPEIELKEIFNRHHETESQIKIRVDQLLVNYPRLNILDLSRCFQFYPSILQCISKIWITQISSLNLQYSTITSRELGILFAGHQDSSLPLKRLNLSNTSISDSVICFIAKKCPMLEDINLSGCVNLTNLSLSALAQYCKKISHVNFAECNKMTNYGIQIIAQESKNNLKSIDLTDCSSIDDEALGFLSYYCTSLSTLNIKGTSITTSAFTIALNRFSLIELGIQAHSHNDSDLIDIVKHQPKLEALDLSFCYNVSLLGIREVALNCSQLKKLSLFGLNLSKGEISSILSDCGRPFLNVLY